MRKIDLFVLLVMRMLSDPNVLINLSGIILCEFGHDFDNVFMIQVFSP